ncbi:MAG: putative membrane protein YeiH, partial [Mariniflexile sp.]
MFYIIDILGTIAFAISGVLLALNKRMDLFGILIIAFVTAVGGGTLRDILIGETPVSWMKDMTYTYVIIASAIFAVIFRSKIDYLRTSLFLFDTIG